MVLVACLALMFHISDIDNDAIISDSLRCCDKFQGIWMLRYASGHTSELELSCVQDSLYGYLIESDGVKLPLTGKCIGGVHIHLALTNQQGIVAEKLDHTQIRLSTTVELTGYFLEGNGAVEGVATYQDNDSGEYVTKRRFTAERLRD